MTGNKLSPQDFTVVLVSVPDDGCAERIARELLEERLAACVQRLPGMRSWFHWQGKLDCADEVLLLIKARRATLTQLKERVAAAHPYEIPEIVALPVFDAHSSYLQWWADCTA